MTRVILQPAGNDASLRHYRDTVKRPVPLVQLANHLPTDDIDILSQAADGFGIATWGVTPATNGSNVGKWRQIQRGDVVLFGGKGVSYASAVVVHTARNAALAHELWGTDPSGNTWEYLFFIAEVREQRVPKSLVNQLAGFALSNAWMGFNVVDEKRSEAILLGLEIGSSSYLPNVSKEDISEEARRLSESGSTDLLSTVFLRKEQAALRRWVFRSERTMPCALCGREYSVEFLVAAHVKKRSICTIEERLDFTNIAMPLCKFGCDDLFEKAYVVVKNGMVAAGNSAPKCEVARTYVAALVGRSCKYWSRSSAPYFSWHAGTEE